MAAKRGAKPLPVIEGEVIELDQARLDARRQDLALMSAEQSEVVSRFGDGLPWAPEHYEAEIRRELRTGCEAFLRAGRLLLVAKHHADHGEWAGMLGRLAIEPRQAQRMMETARRVAALPNPSTSTHLLEAAKTHSKLIELLSLPEDQFAELASEGETGDLTLDDVAAMTIKDLRQAIRDARADMDAKDERAAKRERDVERLTAQVRKLKGERAKATPDEEAEKLRSLASGSALAVRAALGAQGDDVDSIYERIGALLDLGEASGQDHTEFAAGLLGELLGEIRRVRDAFGLPIVNDPGFEG